MIRALIEAGTLRTVIDRVYPFAKIEEAFDHAGAGHKKGHVVILLH
jgi:NADPH:quinone reductase-like Zn-dependent oxidoreductase